MNQRWHQGRASYRPAGEVIRTSDYDVAEIAADSIAKAFVLRHHYSGTYPAARFRFGLYRRGELAGVAVFSVPCHAAVLTNVFPGDFRDSAELGRFVLLDEVPGNGETWFLARCFEQLRGRLVGVVSYSDPCPRTAADGSIVFPGHVGTIYQAFNGAYLGRGRARTLRLLMDGRVFSERAITKIRAQDRGWRYAAARLEAAGAAPLGSLTPSEWLATWLPRVTRPLKSLGNHRYAWGLTRRAQRALPASRPFPKQIDPPRSPHA